MVRLASLPWSNWRLWLPMAVSLAWAFVGMMLAMAAPSIGMAGTLGQFLGNTLPPAQARKSALETLNAQGPAARNYVPQLAPLIADDLLDIRVAAERTLDKIDPAWPKVESAGPAALKLAYRLTPGPGQMSDSEEELARIRKLVIRVAAVNKVVAPGLVVRLHRESFQPVGVVSPIKDLLAELKSAPVDTIPELVLLLSDNDVEIRDASLALLSKANPDWRKTAAVDAASARLISQLESAKVRDDIERLAHAIGLAGPAAMSAGPILIRHIPMAPVACGQALDQIDPNWRQIGAAKELRNRLLKELRVQASSPLTAWIQLRQIVAALAAFGSAAAEAQPLLQPLLAHMDGGVRIAAASTIGAMGPDAKKSAPALAQRLASLSRNTQWEGFGEEQLALIRALSNTTSTTPATINVFTGYLFHSADAIRLAAIDGLGKCGPAAKTALPTLQSFAKNGKPPISTAAEEAVMRIQAKP